MKIHSTAIVDRHAQLGNNVEIGPYTCVGAEVSLGDRSIVQSHAVLEGAVDLGSDNFIGPGTIIGTWPQDLSFDPKTKSSVRIGTRNVIREHVTIHRGTAEGSATSMGDDNYLMAGAHLGHNCSIANKVIIANNCLLGGYVQVEDGAFLGGGCVFHQHMRVGRMAIAQGRSAFGKDIPPFVIAAERNYVVGLNVIGLRRAGFSPQDRDEIKTAFRLLYTSGLNVGQAIEKSATMNVGSAAREFFKFVANAKERGICPLKRGADEEMSI